VINIPQELYVFIACVVYLIIRNCIAYLYARYNRIHQYHHEDDCELKYRETATEEQKT